MLTLCCWQDECAINFQSREMEGGLESSLAREGSFSIWQFYNILMKQLDRQAEGGYWQQGLESVVGTTINFQSREMDVGWIGIQLSQGGVARDFLNLALS